MPTFDQVIADLVISGQSNGEELGSSFRLASGERSVNPIYIASSIAGFGVAVPTVNQLRAFPVIVPRGGTLDLVGAIIQSVGGAGSSLRVGLYTSVGVYPQNLIISSGVIATDALTGVLGAQVISPVITLAAGTLYWGVTHYGTAGASTTTAAFGYPILGFDGNAAIPSNVPLWGWQVAAAFGPLPSVFPQGAVATGGNSFPVIGVRYGSVSRSARAGG